MVPPPSTADALLASIREVSGNPSAGWAVPPEPLRGGYWAEVLKVQLADAPGLEGELVARVMPHAQAAAREVAIQRYLADVGYPTPHIRLASGPTPQLDRAWSLMDFARGSLPLQGLSGLAVFLKAPWVFPRLPERIARLVAALHSIDPAPLAEILSSGDEVGWLLVNLRDRAVGIGSADLEEWAAHLKGNRPEGEEVRICHGDLHPFNVLSGPDGEVVLDWTVARLADPLFDVAFSGLLFAYLPITVPRPVRPLVIVVGRSQARAFLRHYERHTGTRVDRHRLAWYTRVQALRMLIDLEERRDSRASSGSQPHPFEAIAGPLRKVVAGD